MLDRPVDRLRAGLIAAVLSGAPSTLHALATGSDPLEAARAAGSVVLPRERRTLPLLVAAVPAHLAVSLGWAFVIPRRAGVLGGALFGLAVAALDLGVLARWFPRVRALPLGPQVADHVAYGAVVGWALRPGGVGGS
ncbi:MAG TPA: hypothetical protein VGJ32_06385 [Solirubrobacteraceae bacterium]